MQLILFASENVLGGNPSKMTVYFEVELESMGPNNEIACPNVKGEFYWQVQ